MYIYIYIQTHIHTCVCTNACDPTRARVCMHTRKFTFSCNQHGFSSQPTKQNIPYVYACLYDSSMHDYPILHKVQTLPSIRGNLIFMHLICALYSGKQVCTL